MVSVILDGYFTQTQCEVIKEKMRGKTYFNFNIEYSNEFSNCKIVVSSDLEDATPETLKDMFIYACLCELGKKFG